MPYATNPVDGVRTYFDDAGGVGPPVLFYTGYADPLEVARSSRLARALSAEFRLIFADHRGQGGSDKPRRRRCASRSAMTASVAHIRPAGRACLASRTALRRSAELSAS
jgi:pimeloyl-ACP methyl ester carboxylesterase